MDTDEHRLEKDGKDQKDVRDDARGNILELLHFSFSCSAVLSQNTYAEKLTVSI